MYSILQLQEDSELMYIDLQNLFSLSRLLSGLLLIEAGLQSNNTIITILQPSDIAREQDSMKSSPKTMCSQGKSRMIATIN